MTPYRQTFKVKYKNSFPLDMLRYDRCYPATQQDVSVIMLISPHIEFEVEIQRIIFDKKQLPSERWNSFGCTIHSVHTEKLT